jgi:SAM-dependent methyltransferase
VPSSSPSRWRSYRDVDATHDPTLLSGQLDDIASTAAIAAGKRRSLELLDLSPGASVLDVGCGNGPELDALAAIVGPEGRVVGLDRSRALIADAKARGLLERGPIDLVVGDADALPFDDAQFDGCRIDRTLQHLEHPENTLREMLRVTRSGGHVVATEVRWGLAARDLDLDIGARVVRPMATAEERGNWIGYLLPILFQLAGFSDVRLVSEEAVLTDYEELTRFTNLRWSLAEAVREGVLSAEQAQAWDDSLRGQLAKGDARLQIVIVHVVGTRG